MKWLAAVAASQKENDLNKNHICIIVFIILDFYLNRSFFVLDRMEPTIGEEQ
jgi:hypothetical protein